LPYGEGADQILMSSAFGLVDTRNPEVGDQLAEFRRLFRKRHPLPVDQVKMRDLAKIINAASPDLLQFQKEADVGKSLQELITESHRIRESKDSE
jgi:hypothetical protein